MFDLSKIQFFIYPLYQKEKASFPLMNGKSGELKQEKHYSSTLPKFTRIPIRLFNYSELPKRLEILHGLRSSNIYFSTSGQQIMLSVQSQHEINQSFPNMSKN